MSNLSAQEDRTREVAEILSKNFSKKFYKSSEVCDDGDRVVGTWVHTKKASILVVNEEGYILSLIFDKKCPPRVAAKLILVLQAAIPEASILIEATTH